MESRSPTTGAVLGTVAEATAEDVRAARAAAALVQPLWAAVPPAARARYLRRAAQAVLDEVDALAGLLARETGRPRTEALLAELLPSVSGLHALADEGPGALADRRLGRPAILRGGRRAVLVQAPAGVVGVRTDGASPWAEPLLETAASLMAGNAVLLAPGAPLVGERIGAVFLRAGVPGELVAVLHGARAEEFPEPVDAGGDDAKATMLVLAGAPLEAVVTGALWAAFAGAGRHPAAVGRLVVEAESAGPLLEQLVAGARRLRLGDPEHADTEVGPLASQADLETVEALVADAEAGGAERLCGGPVGMPGVSGAFCAPVVLRGVAAGARLLREPPPGPVLAVLEVDSEAAAIALAKAGGRDSAGGAVSVWAGDRAHGERVARGLGADLAWVNEHGHAVPSVPVRLARHVRQQRMASQPSRLRSARWLPYDPTLVRARTAVARLLHGRQSERVAALREGALPLARTALRVARDGTQPAKRSGSNGAGATGDDSPQ